MTSSGPIHHSRLLPSRDAGCGFLSRPIYPGAWGRLCGRSSRGQGQSTQALKEEGSKLLAFLPKTRRVRYSEHLPELPPRKSGAQPPPAPSQTRPFQPESGARPGSKLLLPPCRRE